MNIAAPRKKIVILLLIPFLLFVLTGCTAIGKKSRNFAIYYSLPLRGINKVYAQAVMDGASLAVEEIGGKIGKHSVELIFRDNSNIDGYAKDDIEKRIAREALSNKDIAGYVNAFDDGAANSSMPLINNAQVVHLGIGILWPGLTKPGFAPGEPNLHYPSGKRCFISLTADIDDQSKAAAAWSRQAGFNSVQIISDATELSAAAVESFEAAAYGEGLSVDGSSYAEPEKDMMFSKTSLRNVQSDFIFLAISENSLAARAIKEIRAAGIAVPIIAFGFAIDETTNADGYLDGVMAIYPVSGQEGKMDSQDSFFDKFQSRYGRVPPMYAYYGYESARMILKVISDENEMLLSVPHDQTVDLTGHFMDLSADKEKTFYGYVISGNALTRMEEIRITD